MKTLKRFALISCVGLALLATPALAQDEVLIDFAAVVAPVGVCGGDCAGDANGSASSAKKCADLTPEEITALNTAACADADKTSARREANDICLDKDNSGTCLCLGITWTDTPGTPADVDGKCTVSCTVEAKGECKQQAIAVPDETPTEF